MPMKNETVVYAIIRIDSFHSNHVQIKNSISVIEIVSKLKDAENRVDELNNANSHSYCMYFWQKTCLHEDYCMIKKQYCTNKLI